MKHFQPSKLAVYYTIIHYIYSDEKKYYNKVNIYSWNTILIFVCVPQRKKTIIQLLIINDPNKQIYFHTYFHYRCHMWSRNCTPFQRTPVHPRILVEFVWLDL
jgi:hypothetical protein